MAGIKDVARQAGVSVGTVSNVINRPETVLPETRARVLAAIEDLGYVRSESARQLRAGRSRIMALLVLDMGNPFFVDVARGAERAARQAGLGVMVCNSGQSPAEEAEYLGLFAEQRVCGVLVTPADATGRNLESFSRHRIPYVLVDRVASGTGTCAVSVDDVRGGALAVGHLISAGHRSVAYVSGPGDLHQIRDRRTGALSALAEAGLEPEALVEIPSDRLDVAAGRDAEPGCSAWYRAPPPCSAPTTCSPSVCCRRSTRPGCGSRRTSPSSDTTTSNSPPPLPCRSPRSASPPW